MSLLRKWCKTKKEKETNVEPDNSFTNSAVEFIEEPEVNQYPDQQESPLGAVAYNGVIAAVEKAKVASNLSTSYFKYNATEKYKIGKNASENGSSNAVRKFLKEFPTLKESTVRGFRKKYEKLLVNNRNTSPTKAIELEKRGRPLILSNLDEKVRTFLMNIRKRGGVVNTAIASSTAKTFIEQSKNKNAFSVPTISWAMSLLKRMGFRNRAAATGKLSIPLSARKEAELIYLHKIVAKVEKHHIPPSLVVNLDQNSIKTCPVISSHNGSKGATTVEIVGSNDKRSITATFVISIDGKFLPMKLIYDGKTEKSIPQVNFAPSFSLSANRKHFSNTKESVKIINEILVPYFDSQREKS